MNDDPRKTEAENQGPSSCCRSNPACCNEGRAAAEEESCKITEECPEPMSATSMLQTQLQHLQREVEEHKDKYLRVLAEMENMRKRLQKEKQDISKYAAENVIVEFLAPFDQFETALQYAEQMSGEVKNWAMGFTMILTQLKDVLANQEVRAFDSVGSAFNPHMHEAVEMVESEDHPAGTIVKEYTKGYKMGDRIIRPARVQVAKEMETSADEESGSSQIKA